MMYNLLLLTAMLAARPASSARPPTKSEAELLQVEVTSRHMQRTGTSNQGVHEKQVVEEALTPAQNVKNLDPEPPAAKPAGAELSDQQAKAREEDEKKYKAEMDKLEEEDFQNHEPEAKTLKAALAEERNKGDQLLATQRTLEAAIAELKKTHDAEVAEQTAKADAGTAATNELAATAKEEDEKRAVAVKEASDKVAAAQKAVEDQQIETQKKEEASISALQKVQEDDARLKALLEGMVQRATEMHTAAVASSDLATEAEAAAEARAVAATEAAAKGHEEAERIKTEADAAAEKVVAEANEQATKIKEASLATAQTMFEEAEKENANLKDAANKGAEAAKAAHATAAAAAATAVTAEKAAADHLAEVTKRIAGHEELKDGLKNQIAGKLKDPNADKNKIADLKECNGEKNQKTEERPFCTPGPTADAVCAANYAQCTRCATSSGRCISA